MAKVGDKVFTRLRPESEGERIVVRVGEASFEILTARDGIEQGPYFTSGHGGRSQPLRRSRRRTGATPSSGSMTLAAAGLSKKRHRELGIIRPQ